MKYLCVFILALLAATTWAADNSECTVFQNIEDLLVQWDIDLGSLTEFINALTSSPTNTPAQSTVNSDLYAANSDLACLEQQLMSSTSTFNAAADTSFHSALDLLNASISTISQQDSSVTVLDLSAESSAVTDTINAVCDALLPLSIQFWKAATNGGDVPELSGPNSCFAFDSTTGTFPRTNPLSLDGSCLGC